VGVIIFDDFFSLGMKGGIVRDCNEYILITTTHNTWGWNSLA